MADKRTHKYKDIKSPKRARDFKSTTSPKNTSKQIEAVYSNLIGKAILSSPTRELPFSANRGHNVSSPKHVISPHKIQASQFKSSDAYKSRIDREIKSHIIVNNKENISSIEPKVMLPHKPIALSNTNNIMKSPPRKIEIHRKKKLYESVDINKLLFSKGIDYNKYDNKTDHLTGKPSILSLFIFDLSLSYMAILNNYLVMQYYQQMAYEFGLIFLKCSMI
eukprot:302899_1